MRIDRGIHIYAGGLLGACMVKMLGYDAMIVDNKYSVLISQDHASIKAINNIKPSNKILKQIAKYLGYQDYKIKKDGDLYFINRL